MAKRFIADFDVEDICSLQYRGLLNYISVHHIFLMLPRANSLGTLL